MIEYLDGLAVEKIVAGCLVVLVVADVIQRLITRRGRAK